MAIIIVVGLHVLTAVALVAMKPSAPKVALPKETPPIEIQMVTLPAEIKEPEVAMDTAEPVKPIQPQPKSVATTKPKIAKESQPLAKTKPAVKPAATSENPKTKTQPDTTKAVENEPFKHKVKPQESISTVQADALAADNERKILAAQAEKAAQQAHAKAAQEAKRLADAKEAAEVRASKEADAAAKAAAAAASDTPVNFTASAANWSSAPNFSFPDRAARRAHSGDTLNVVLVLRVNKQGGIDSVRVAQSSGNAALDKEAQRQVRSGKFKPFMKNGAAVVGNVTLPIAYTVP
ncbi:energy transducer TonB [Psychrobacter sp. DAB_AL62B]|uniref:energy transducer TonB n=1 Tax=Psychrobacter sp. DAB_AL62B TaxID=1028420 RepID=UPI0023811811|nr:energy transducer TonB [Psychrobacter sp. DAB_AL62B]